MKKRLLIISPYLPYPLNHGGAVAQYFFLENLSELYNISFLSELKTLEEKNDAEYLKKSFPLITFLFFENYSRIQPIEKTRWWIKIKVLVHKMLSKWKLLPKSMITNTSYSAPKNDTFGKFISDQFIGSNFDIVQFEFFGTLPYIDYVPKNTFSVFIHHEIKYKALGLRSKKDVPLIEKVKIFEIEKLKMFSKIAVFNENDKNLLTVEGLNRIYLSQFGLPLSFHLKRNVSTNFNKFIFLGSEKHYANVEGLKWFFDKIYIPNYAQLAPIYITGYWSDNFQLKFKKFEKINFVGFIEDIEELFEESVLLCPIISGAGIRTKILQAFANKVPVFSTEMGAEGLLNGNKHIVIFDDHTFMGLYKSYFNNTSLKQIAVQGNAYYNKFFKTEELIQQRIKLYNND